MKGWFLFVSLFFSSFLLQAQPVVKKDSAAITARAFNGSKIEKFKSNKDFQYNKYTEPPKSIWQRFWSWVWFKVGQLMSTKTGRNTVYIVFIILAVLALAFFILKVTGMDGGKLFGRKGRGGLDYSISSDDIHQISFDDAIQKAIASGNFRLAIRLLYLQSLKKLSDKELIDWQIDKTNSDYIHEVINRSWHSLFSQLTHQFEYVWYGEMKIGKEDFERLQLQFQQFNNQL